MLEFVPVQCRSTVSPPWIVLTHSALGREGKSGRATMSPTGGLFSKQTQPRPAKDFPRTLHSHPFCVAFFSDGHEDKESEFPTAPGASHRAAERVREEETDPDTGRTCSAGSFGGIRSRLYRVFLRWKASEWAPLTPSCFFMNRHVSTRKLMARNTADCVVLVLMHFPTLNLRIPEAGDLGHSSAQFSAGGPVPEVTSGCPGHVCANNSSNATWCPEVAAIWPGGSWSPGLLS
ncbi:uncharacterized protein LOC115278817 [Suricata suricatta]|uniref:uncharacterized protein LOC115278817 n=1 Tax=Suricata suricatta TaxID=37032 RepID=UPI001155FF6A|nr:uncharacterized protein LOC115278817 [Suricata suricatta]XP_029779168.1 uncharacterized protein LOC115278817 [Suricata suricatta]XP_029779173.1 uncharacterized protein LOC115278817 [Suricata suricatta]XP_029779175.1 uncharacterized protein LOC115278817 [Suricata suricatta]XP_029779179.1 uncharacterized protein LOC115278817 [Suricata suricatta]XP_029779185.1 uncharacterized protein LOC115278817 [Suricata suricatta]